MNRKILAQAICSACLLGLSANLSIAWAAEWNPELLPTEGKVRKPSEPIRIRIANLPPGAAKRMTVELDDLDITATIKRQGNVFIYTPAQPLAKGKHSLRLVEYAPDGSINEQGNWEFDIRKSKHIRESALEVNATLDITQRTYEDNIDAGTKRSSQTGSVRLNGSIANKNWRVNGNADFVYNSQKDQTQRGEKWDLGTYLFTHSVKNVETNVGHHPVGPDSMVMQGFSSRGLSVKYSKPATGFNITGFAMRTEQITGFREGLGIGDSDNLIQGVTLTSRPIKSNRNALVVSATVLSGEGPDQTGETTGGDSTVSSGSAASLVADASFKNQKMRLRGELAGTSFDADGSGTALDEENANAYSLLFQYTPWTNKQLKGKPVSASFTVGNLRIGTGFRSPANPAPISDAMATQASFSFNWSGLDLQIQAGRQEDNVEDDVLLPTTETDSFIFNLSYSPEVEYSDDGTPKTKHKWLGQPTYSLTYTRSDQDIIAANGSSFSKGSLSAINNLGLSASFQLKTWNWGLTHNIGESSNFADSTAVENKTQTTGFNASINLGEKIQLAPNVEWTVEEDRITGGETTTLLTGISFTYSGKKISSNLGISLNQNRNPGDSITDPTRTETLTTTGSITWSAIEAKGRKPGLSLTLEGTHTDTTDDIDPTQSSDSLQINLKAVIGWSARF